MKINLQFFGGRGGSSSGGGGGGGPKVDGKPAVVNGERIDKIIMSDLDANGNIVNTTQWQLSSNNGFWSGYEMYDSYNEAAKAARESGGTIVNGNKVSKVGKDWVVESANGSWSGYELYKTKKAAMNAAKS